MKLSAAIAIALIGVTSAPALAGGPRFRGRTNTYHEEFCYKYVEKYVPGYYNKHGRYVGGYVKSRKEKVPCWSINRPSYPDRYEDPAPNVGGGVDDNSCVEGAVLGGILGGGAGAAASRGDGRWWACLLYTSPSPRDGLLSRMPSSA